MAIRKPKRQSIRFPANDGTLALIDFNSSSREFEPTLHALVVEEAHKGCSFVSVSSSEFRERQELRVKIGQMPVLKAEIRWVKNIEPRVYVVGVFYLE